MKKFRLSTIYEKIIENDSLRDVILIDEESIETKSERDLEKIRQIYMQLKANRDTSEDYDLAHCYYYREMEIKRKISILQYIENYKKYAPWHRKNKTRELNWIDKKLLHLVPMLFIILPFILTYILEIYFGPILTLAYIIIYICIFRKYISYIFYFSYWFLSAYGNRPMITFWWFFISLIMFSACFICLSLIEKVDYNNKYIMNDIHKSDINKSQKVFFFRYSSYNFTELINEVTSMKKYSPQLNIQEICNVSIWILSSEIGLSLNYKIKENITSELLLLIIKYMIRPIMLSLFIISMRRKVQRS